MPNCILQQLVSVFEVLLHYVITTDFTHLCSIFKKRFVFFIEKLDISPQDLQHVVEALVNLLLEACKHKVSSTFSSENLNKLLFVYLYINKALIILLSS